MGVEIYYAGKSYIIDSEQHQILDMLMFTFEHAVQQGRELIKMQLELKTFNEQLEEKVKERTAALKRSEDALRKAYDDLRQTQQMVMQQERMRALGQMASGIVHDINNTLSPIVVYTNLLLTSEPNLSERTKRYLRNIQMAGTDISHIVARMREFYRQREGRELLFQSFLPKKGLSLSDDWGWCGAEICREFTLPCRPSTSDNKHYVNLIGEGEPHWVPPSFLR